MAQCAKILARNAHRSLSVTELDAVVARVLEQPEVYVIHCKALYERCITNKDDRRSIDRTVCQMDALCNHMLSKLAARVRLRLFFAVDLAPIWTRKCALAAVYRKFDLTKSALDIYEDLAMYEPLIECMMQSGQVAKAEALIRSKIEEDETNGKMWCYLGDITRDREHYLKAWDLSNGRLTKAKRLLGNECVFAKQWQQAIAHFQDTLAVNALQPMVWFSLGFCAMELEQWDLAAQGFTRCVAINPDDGKSWNNLAAVYMHKRDRPQAFNALEQSVQFNRDSWQVWDNYLSAAIDVGEVAKALHAINHLIDLQDRKASKGDNKFVEDKRIDPGILGMIADLIVEQHCDYMEQLKDEQRQGEKPKAAPEFLVKRFRETMGRITAKIKTNAQLFAVFAHFYQGIGNASKAQEYRQKQVRNEQKIGWHDDADHVERVIKAAHGLLDSFLMAPEKRHHFSAKLTVNKINRKLQEIGRNDAADALSAKLSELGSAVGVSAASTDSTDSSSRSLGGSSLSDWR